MFKFCPLLIRSVGFSECLLRPASFPGVRLPRDCDKSLVLVGSHDVGVDGHVAERLISPQRTEEGHLLERVFLQDACCV